MASLGKLFAGGVTGVASGQNAGAGVTGSRITVDNGGDLFGPDGQWLYNMSNQDGFGGRRGGGKKGSGSGGSGGKRNPRKPAGGYKDDGAIHMPNSNATLEAIRKIQQELAARSGRTSTDLTSGRRSYFGSIVGKR